jgi:nitrate/nitrite transporter NarK
MASVTEPLLPPSDEPIKITSKAESWLRWPILVLSCMAMFGSYYCYDNPSALQTPLQNALNIDHMEYNWLYSVYSLPNMILPLFGGILVDKLSVNICIVLFLSFIVVGQALFALGVTIKSYALMLVGRTIFGFGGESLCVAESTLLAVWFKGKEVALAMGINLTVARLGSVANDNLSPFWFRHSGLDTAVWFGFGLAIVCMVCVLGMVVLDKHATKKYGGHAKDENQEEKPFQIRDLLDFNVSFWLISISCLVVYGTVLPFNNVSQSFLMQKYGFDQIKAGAIQGIPFTISAIASPFLGGAVDRIGQRATLLALSAAFLTLTHSLMAFTDLTPYVTLAILGTSYAIYSSAMWPSIAYVVPENVLGSAYGIATSIQNFGLFAFPLVVGSVRDASPSYKNVEIFFALIGLIGLVVGVVLNVVDYRNGGKLNKSSFGGSKDGESKKIVEVDVDADCSQATNMSA